VNKKTCKITRPVGVVKVMMPNLLTLFCRLVNGTFDCRAEFLKFDSCKWLFFRYIRSPQAFIMDDIYFTLDVSNADVNRIPLQVEDAPRQWHSQSPSRQGHRWALSARRFFRSQRSVTSQVRDDPASGYRGLVGDTGGKCLWRVQALILPRPYRLHSRWPGGINSEKAGPQRRLQTLSRGHGVCPGSTPGQPTADDGATGPSYCPTVRFLRASPKHRESFSPAGKKTDGDLRVNPDLPDIVERYEALRVPLSQTAASQTFGWLVLVQRGLWAWSQRVQSQLPSVAPQHAAHCLPAHLQEPVTHVLASMILQVYPEVAYAN